MASSASLCARTILIDPAHHVPRVVREEATAVQRVAQHLRDRVRLHALAVLVLKLHLPRFEQLLQRRDVAAEARGAEHDDGLAEPALQAVGEVGQRSRDARECLGASSGRLLDGSCALLGFPGGPKIVPGRLLGF